MEKIVPQISFVILSWNSERYLNRCIDSIVEQCRGESIPFEVVVVDNGSSDRSVGIMQEYQRLDPDSFNCLTLDRNSGTTYSRNRGFERSRGDYLCVLDSDTEIAGAGLKDVLRLLAERRQVGLVAPRLLLPDGSVQNSVKRFPTMWNKLVKIPRILFGIETGNADFYDGFPFDNEREVDSAISACWIFRRELLQTVGCLDEKIFYAPEDLDYSLRVRRAGYSILYYPAYRVLHHTQQITHKKPLSRTSLSHFAGLLYYYRKHGGWLFRPKPGGERRC